MNTLLVSVISTVILITLISTPFAPRVDENYMDCDPKLTGLPADNVPMEEAVQLAKVWLGLDPKVAENNLPTF